MPDDNNTSLFVIAYSAMAFSGFLVGLLTGWIIWAQ